MYKISATKRLRLKYLIVFFNSVFLIWIEHILNPFTRINNIVFDKFWFKNFNPFSIGYCMQVF